MDNPIDNRDQSEVLTRREQRELERQQRLAQYKREEHSFVRRRVLIWLGVIIGLALIIFLMVRFASNIGTPATGQPLSSPINATDWGFGNKDAQATLVEYGDFQCPACGAYHPLLKKISQDYKDRLYFVFRNFPLRNLHPNAQLAAQAAGAAGKQGKFWEMHDILYENQEKWAQLQNPQDAFLQYAQSLKLNIDQFKKDLTANDVIDKINTDYASGLASSVGGTPTLFLNGKEIDNPTSYAEFKQIIDQALTQTPAPSAGK